MRGQKSSCPTLAVLTNALLAMAMSLNLPAIAHGGGGGGHGGGGHSSCGGGHAGSHGASFSGFSHSTFGGFGSCSHGASFHISGGHQSFPSASSNLGRNGFEHVGFFGHMHRMFAGTSSMTPISRTELPSAIISTEAAHLNTVQFDTARAHLPLCDSEILSLSMHGHSPVYRQLYTNSGLGGQPLYGPDYTITQNQINELNEPMELDMLNQISENADSTPNDKNLFLESMPSVQNQPTFTGLAYMLPNPNGILATYFAHENPANDYLLQNKENFLWIALNQTSQSAEAPEPMAAPETSETP